MYRNSKRILLLALVCFSNVVFSQIKILDCEVKGYAYNSGMGQKDFPKENITLKIEKIGKELAMETIGNFNYTMGVTSMSDESYLGKNLSNSQKYWIEVEDKTTNIEYDVQLDRVLGRLRVYSHNISGEMPTTLTFSGTCKEVKNSPKF